MVASWVINFGLCGLPDFSDALNVPARYLKQQGKQNETNCNSRNNDQAWWDSLGHKSYEYPERWASMGYILKRQTAFPSRRRLKSPWTGWRFSEVLKVLLFQCSSSDLKTSPKHSQPQRFESQFQHVPNHDTMLGTFTKAVASKSLEQTWQILAKSHFTATQLSNPSSASPHLAPFKT